MSSACEPLGLRPWVFYIYLLAMPAASQACGLEASIYISACGLASRLRAHARCQAPGAWC